MIPKLRIVVALTWTLLIFGLCWTPRTMLPVPEEPGGFFLIPNLDKVVHFGLFAGFGFLWGWAGLGTRWVVATGVLAAVLSELGQATAFVNRDAEWSDGTADVLGVLAGLAALVFLRQRLPFLARPTPIRTPSAETP